MTRRIMNKTGIALALATALFLLTNAALAGPNSRCYQIYDWYTGIWKVVCLPW